MEYTKHIEFYELYHWAGFSKLIPDPIWGDKKLAEKYLQKYWLTEQEYLSIWKPIQDSIFIQGKSLPDLIYHPKFEIIALMGGCLFLEEDFLQLQKTLQEVGEEYFVIIQHSQAFTEGEPMFRMKFPVDITWEELTSGNYISAILLEMSYNEYFIFGGSGKWGKYSANDYDCPLDIIGFKSELSANFNDNFPQTESDKIEASKWLPQEYKNLM